MIGGSVFHTLSEGKQNKKFIELFVTSSLANSWRQASLVVYGSDLMTKRHHDYGHRPYGELLTWKNRIPLRYLLMMIM